MRNRSRLRKSRVFLSTLSILSWCCLSWSMPSQEALAQNRQTADASAYDLISFEHLMSLSASQREAYLTSVRQLLGELSQRRQNSEIFSQFSDEERLNRFATISRWLSFASATAESCPAGMESVTLRSGGGRATVCRVARRDADVSQCLNRPGTMIVRTVGQVGTTSYGAHCILAADADELRHLRDSPQTQIGEHTGLAYRPDGQLPPPESRAARAEPGRTEINPENEDVHQACRSSETVTPEQRRQRLETFRAHSRQNGGTCLHAGNLSRYGSPSGDFSAESVRAGNCRGRSSFEVIGFRVQCANPNQVLCNPLIYGLASVTQDEPTGTRQGVGRCVPRSGNATRTCDQRFGQSQDGESAGQFISRSVPGIREAYEDFRRNLARFCNTPASREAHCDECRVIRERIAAAARGAGSPPRDQPGQPGRAVQPPQRGQGQGTIR